MGPRPRRARSASKPLLLSTATRGGVTEVLRATMAAIEAGRADAAATLAAPEPWSPL